MQGIEAACVLSNPQVTLNCRSCRSGRIPCCPGNSGRVMKKKAAGLVGLAAAMDHFFRKSVGSMFRMGANPVMLGRAKV